MQNVLESDVLKAVAIGSSDFSMLKVPVVSKTGGQVEEIKINQGYCFQRAASILNSASTSLSLVRKNSDRH